MERFELQRDYFEKALLRLQEVLKENETDFIRDSIVQRFEFTFEMAWKTMFQYLTNKGESLAKNAWTVIPAAFAARLVTDAEVWDKLRAYRNDSSHEYNERRAIEIAAYIRTEGVNAFVALAAELRKRG